MEQSEQRLAWTREKAAFQQGDAERTAKQHAEGKSTARERLAKLFDAGSLMEIDALRADSNAVAGCGTVNGQAVYAFAQDYAAMGGAMTRQQAAKLLKILEMAQTNGAPVALLLDSAGVKLHDGMEALPAYAEILSALARLSGVCPLISPGIDPFHRRANNSGVVTG